MPGRTLRLWPTERREAAVNVKVQIAKHIPEHLPLGPAVLTTSLSAAGGRASGLVLSLWEHVPLLASAKSIIPDRSLLAHKAFVEKLPPWRPESVL